MTKLNETLDGRMQIYVSALLHHVHDFKPDLLEDRYRELALAPVLAEAVRHNVYAVRLDDTDGLDLLFPDKIPKAVEASIRNAGNDIAACILGARRPVEKDVLREIAASSLLASRFVAEKVAATVTTPEERAALASAAAQVFGEMVVTMTHAITMNQSDTGECGTA